MENFSPESKRQRNFNLGCINVKYREPKWGTEFIFKGHGLLSTMAPPAVTGRSMLAMFKYDVSRELPAIRVPALIIAANKDRLTKPIASKYMMEHLPNAGLVTLAPANHQGLIERHTEVNAAAEWFIQSLR